MDVDTPFSQADLWVSITTSRRLPFSACLPAHSPASSACRSPAMEESGLGIGAGGGGGAVPWQQQLEQQQPTGGGGGPPLLPAACRALLMESPHGGPWPGGSTHPACARIVTMPRPVVVAGGPQQAALTGRPVASGRTAQALCLYYMDVSVPGLWAMPTHHMAAAWRIIYIHADGQSCSESAAI